MKKLFDTPKKAVISIICIVAVIAATGTMAVKSTLIGKAEAKNIALRDAGINEAEASALRAKLEFDDGRFQYEVDFYSNGTEYEYFIQGKDGDIIARDIDGGPNGSRYEQSQPSDPENQPAANTGNSIQPQEISQEISVEEAKATALEDAGLSEADVTFKKAALDYDDKIHIYDIEFYTSDTEYDYEINAIDKTVLEKNIEPFQTQANPAGSETNNSDSNDIGVDSAKEIALNHANLNEADVRFVKAELENDDGKMEYEIEFYSGGTEYDYTIDAVSGNIVEHDIDYH